MKFGDDPLGTDHLNQQSLNLGSAQFQILFAVSQRFAMMKIYDRGPGWK